MTPPAGARSRPGRALIGFLGASLAVLIVGGLVTRPAIDTWYAALDKPAWTPPDWVFGPVWTLLYALMAVAAWLVWRRGGWQGARTALTLYFVQLALNFLWSPLFFGLRSPGLGLLDIVALLGALAATCLAFWRVYAPAAWMMVPYLLWVAYAASLNAAIWLANGPAA